jgi:hypothetical protein
MRLHRLRVPGAHNLEPLDQLLKLLLLFISQCDIPGGKVLKSAGFFARARERDDVRPKRGDPSDAKLCVGNALAFSNSAETVN